ncbi:Formate/nitrite transporter [Penicillium maclennaniae]|uniref:Formate/nitrite transporter n=1 Tax=Penicillium maclennaniae TaxID=1343394 RepID=UPI00254232F3|nr:Formate/nitrite transporter [Penicillium maclennaniae]KAJ5682110.1 Formate/nitrite transporter [Penicillium maclennaniae]
MTFIPLGIWVGTPGITVGLYIWKGIIPTLIGTFLAELSFVKNDIEASAESSRQVMAVGPSY